MSEYEYYEFQAIDRPLTPEEQEAVAALSSRVDPHPRRAIFTYSFGGSLYPSSKELIADYFDAMFYIANWGSVQLAFRFPKALVDLERMAAYRVPTLEYPSDAVSIETKGEYAILTLSLEEEDGFGWIEGEGLLDSVIGLRDDILRGDYRTLYLAWLSGVTSEYNVDEDSLEPPVPPGLDRLTPALLNFCELFEIDDLLVEVAAEASEAVGAESDRWLLDGLAQLSREECESFLLRLAQGELHLGLALRQRLRELARVEERFVATESRRTVAQILARWEEREEEEQRWRAEEAERRRIERLEALAQRVEETWAEIDALIQRKQAQPYDEVTELLCQLKELAAYQGREAEFEARIAELAEAYSRRTALMRRFRHKGLIPLKG
jgi:hypothetical protein